ncbi:hypothetical protein QR680_011248 [Steinernema hermaphroditum]|uniref:ADP-ribosylation factor-like protein 2 n=1 Tax=Steinernema hermaphroditum TaxID=289476 RepID=A0AA39MD58_9BILA|nr:hypothetical protein QR680_011248 [Steinernema hermaphroditum]
MGLSTILRKQKEKEREIRVLILGLDNAGKTTILKKINGEDVNVVSPTLGFNIKTLHLNSWKLNVWDVGGQVSLRSFWRNYFEQTDALIWVVDSGDAHRLNDCARELSSLLGEERLLGCTLLVLANKQDLPGAYNLAQISKLLNLNDIKSHNWRIFECSAVTGSNLLNALEWMCQDVSSRIFVHD